MVHTPSPGKSGKRKRHRTQSYRDRLLDARVLRLLIRAGIGTAPAVAYTLKRGRAAVERSIKRLEGAGKVKVY